MMRTFLFLMIFAIMLVKTKLQDSQDYSSDNDDYHFYCNDSDLALQIAGVQVDYLSDHFVRSSKLNCLTMQSDGIRTLAPDAFESLPNLEYLDLSDNPIDLNELFSINFKHLKVLVASYNVEMQHYDRRYNGYEFILSMKRSLSSIQKLFLNSCRIRSIQIYPNVTFPSLTHLNLSDNYLDDTDFEWLPTSLKYLNLQGNRLRSLNLQNLPNLKWLLLGNSPDYQIESFSLKNLQSLNSVSIPSNGLTEISSDAFVNVSNLAHLDLSKNKIKIIKGNAFMHLQKLVHLNLSSNSIEFIEYGILDDLVDLRYLNLEKNNIKVFTKFNNETKLETLHLNCNLLTSLSNHVFANMPKLENLYLHGNQILKVESKTFVGLESLKILTLSNNKLSHLPKDWMTPLTNITTIDLVGNSILRLQDLNLNKNVPLQNLYLSQLTYIDARYLTDVPENSMIHINSNLTTVEMCTPLNNFNED